jgi:hypothetical protein
MITRVVQGWRRRRASYRPQGEVIDTSQYEVAPIDSDTEAKRFVLETHYSGSYPVARFRYGLYRGQQLTGVAVFSVPMRLEVFDPLPCPHEASVELGRFVLLDDVPSNGETWFLSRALRDLARRGIEGVVSFSDPVPRMNADGRVVFKGHIGNIYQASSALYVGQAKPRTLRLFADGSVFSERAASKIRKREQGWRYAAAQLVAFGATPLREREDSVAWLRYWRPRLTRTLRHEGNHKYLFPIAKGLRKPLEKSLTATGQLHAYPVFEPQLKLPFAPSVFVPSAKAA